MAMIQSRTVDGVLLIVFRTHSILDELSVQQATKELNHAVYSTTQTRIVIDLERIEMMTSVMISALLALKKKCDANNIKLQLCNLTRDIAKIFKVTRLDKLFSIQKSRAKALAAA